jgi:hypothetical protein
VEKVIARNDEAVPHVDDGIGTGRADRGGLPM